MYAKFVVPLQRNLEYYIKTYTHYGKRRVETDYGRCQAMDR